VRSCYHSPNPQAGGPSLVGYPRLLIEYIRSYSPHLEAVSCICNPWVRHAVGGSVIYRLAGSNPARGTNIYPKFLSYCVALWWVNCTNSTRQHCHRPGAIQNIRYQFGEPLKPVPCVQNLMISHLTHYQTEIRNMPMNRHIHQAECSSLPTTHSTVTRQPGLHSVSVVSVQSTQKLLNWKIGPKWGKFRLAAWQQFGAVHITATRGIRGDTET